ncbi:B12-binding domain-containing radical SAM protein [Alistipes dispar]|uniref:B12-binding domain-containing radical SAM protein n=1 Tax=Alistipes dispar TaxID=2585119 RepID=UPI003A88FFFA
MKESESLHFTGTIWRPPFEARSVLLQVTVGCTHHACKFCSLYGDLRFRISPAEEVEADLRIVARYQPRARRVFLVGANPFVLSAGRLIRLADRIRDFLPKVRTIGMFARVSDILQKSAAELRELRARGITGISIGTESGDDASLAFMNKGTTAAEALEACRRLDEAGIEYYLTYMTGLAGAGNGTRAAHATAALFNRLHPYIVGIVSLTLFPDTPLMREIEAGRFVPMSERERLEELRTFLKELTVPVTISANTVSNAVPLFGRLPEDRARMIGRIDEALASLTEADLTGYRQRIGHL